MPDRGVLPGQSGVPLLVLSLKLADPRPLAWRRSWALTALLEPLSLHKRLPWGRLPWFAPFRALFPDVGPVMLVRRSWMASGALRGMQAEHMVLAVGAVLGMVLIGAAMIPDDVWEREGGSEMSAVMTHAVGAGGGIANPVLLHPYVPADTPPAVAPQDTGLSSAGGNAARLPAVPQTVAGVGDRGAARRPIRITAGDAAAHPGDSSPSRGPSHRNTRERSYPLPRWGAISAGDRCMSG